MTGTELRYLLGQYYAAQEEHNGIAAGLLATCWRRSIPVFVGAPGDGSVFLNSMKLWAMREAGVLPEYGFDLDLHAEVFEACAYHRWGLFDHPVHALGTVILGGGVPKNYNLQPEPALGQILGLAGVRGYDFDVQIVTAPVTDGSLSSCPPAEAVTWGKVDKDKYLHTTESMQADYSMVMPFLVKALLDNRARYRRMAEEQGEEALFARRAQGSRLPATRRRVTACSNSGRSLCAKLIAEVRNNREWLLAEPGVPAGGRALESRRRHGQASFSRTASFYYKSRPATQIDYRDVVRGSAKGAFTLAIVRTLPKTEVVGSRPPLRE